MNVISQLRFDSLAGYSRSPAMALFAQELAWYEEGKEKLLGLVVLDLPDQDFASYILGRDAKGRFRLVWLECSIETQEAATELLEAKLAEFVRLPPESFHKGDEVGRPVDFFVPVVKEGRQHRVFSTLISARGHSPARALIGEMMHYFEDVDGNFIEQFQSDGFDARIWELYLYALLTELGYGLDRSHPAPDFHCQGLLGDFFIEATTINPSGVAPCVDASSQQAYFEHYVPLKYGGVLFSKLKKRYWELPHVAAHPFVVAVQDFHAPHSMTWSNSALVEYLYAIRQIDRVNGHGEREVVSERVTEYRWENKPPVSAGFFFLPDSENVSAVLANPSGTLLKFNRIGFLAGFGDRDIGMVRRGLCYRESLWPEEFSAKLDSAYTETWCEGLSVYHNPHARVPLSPDAFPGAAHYTMQDGCIVTFRQPAFHPLGSTTFIVVPRLESPTD
jgi:hypothetical protein